LAIAPRPSKFGALFAAAGKRMYPGKRRDQSGGDTLDVACRSLTCDNFSLPGSDVALLSTFQRNSATSGTVSLYSPLLRAACPPTGTAAHSGRGIPVLVAPRAHGPPEMLRTRHSPMRVAPRAHGPKEMLRTRHPPMLVAPRAHGPKEMLRTRHPPMLVAPRAHGPKEVLAGLVGAKQ